MIRPLMATLTSWIVASHVSAVEIKEESVSHAGVRFRVVRLEHASLQLVWKDDKGTPYRTFDKVQAACGARGRKVKFIMNAGIFEPGGVPSGLYVEAGREWLPLNKRKGEGNFYLHPGGVFSWSIGSAAPSFIRMTTMDEALPPLPSKDCMAIQAGPMLLIDGKRHSAFKEGSTNRLHRNGVGIDGNGKVVFAITSPGQTVNFWDFAGLFLKLGCGRALFLDGDISQMEVNPTAPTESNMFGAMFVVAE
ncbi:phosphodiester glycosidase family protein [Luteolibacter ambystomatis]|uniref:Phosphodiester glycosidase family protein n=1 Tax=Luteolibacter ambystomatis TaxID=2824561 RepID=A0A975J219_9BACT|nr:phosphodiester glycosidase family protein [Luteolibacter ambystomatis]QUE52547.1 phosphodiester glycosidase family protein [Luteolibacter ambystomatis]